MIRTNHEQISIDMVNDYENESTIRIFFVNLLYYEITEKGNI